MRAVLVIAVAAELSMSAALASAQFVKSNEAVTAMSDGSRRVETPPLPPAALAKPCRAEQPGCAGGDWNMVETRDGHMECTEIYARPGTCRASRYGREKRSRVWIVRTKSQWLQCKYPDLGSQCVSTKSLPYAAVQ